MTHEKAFSIVMEHASSHAGLLWNICNATAGDIHGCDTTWAVSHQYDDDETDEAIADLKTLASGQTPNEWESYDGDSAAITTMNPKRKTSW